MASFLVLNARVGPLAAPESPYSPHASAEVVVRGTLQSGREADVTCIHFDYWESLLQVSAWRMSREFVVID
jgi:hypothetical protein